LFSLFGADYRDAVSLDGSVFVPMVVAADMVFSVLGAHHRQVTLCHAGSAARGSR
jgi:hypothetical protein